MASVKYPRTFHLPWSLGLSDDDKAHKDADALFAGQQVVVTEKLDGENTTLYSSGHTHARSMDSGAHPSRSWVRALAATAGAGLPEGWRVCGENVFAKHSVAYKALPSYFLVFGIYDEMVQDLTTIVHCFSARLYGLRNYKKSLEKALAVVGVGESDAAEPQAECA